MLHTLVNVWIENYTAYIPMYQILENEKHRTRGTKNHFPRVENCV